MNQLVFLVHNHQFNLQATHHLNPHLNPHLNQVQIHLVVFQVDNRLVHHQVNLVHNRVRNQVDNPLATHQVNLVVNLVPNHLNQVVYQLLNLQFLQDNLVVDHLVNQHPVLLLNQVASLLLFLVVQQANQQVCLVRNHLVSLRHNHHHHLVNVSVDAYSEILASTSPQQLPFFNTCMIY